MDTNNSPWIQQLKRTRHVARIKENTVADVAIIGGGIAGISTAYFTLKHTDKKVLLVEAGKIAHGATGHNAGQIVSYF
jgi:glycine/D-amino acid oxidase-like deaminating enzyme